MSKLYHLLRSRFFYRIFIWVLNDLPCTIPAKRLRETKTLLAFLHPKSNHPFHVIIVPKKANRSLANLNPADPFLVDMMANVQNLVAEYHLTAYRLIVNGGEYQEFPHLHFHLISDK